MSENKIKVDGIFSKGFGMLSKMVMQDRELHYIAKVIYSYFCSFAGNGESCFPTRSKICYDLQLSIDTFSKYLKQLVEVGYIEVEQIKENGRFSHNIYTILTTKSPCPKRTDTDVTVYGQTDTNNNSLKNNNSFNNKEKNIKKEKKSSDKDYDENFEKLWDMLKPNSNDRKSKISKKRKKELYKMGFERTKKATELYLKVQEPKYYHKRDNFFNDIIDNYLDKTVNDFNLSDKTGLESEASYDIETYENYDSSLMLEKYLSLKRRNEYVD